MRSLSNRPRPISRPRSVRRCGRWFAPRRSYSGILPSGSRSRNSSRKRSDGRRYRRSGCSSGSPAGGPTRSACGPATASWSAGWWSRCWGRSSSPAPGGPADERSRWHGMRPRHHPRSRTKNRLSRRSNRHRQPNRLRPCPCPLKRSLRSQCRPNPSCPRPSPPGPANRSARRASSSRRPLRTRRPTTSRSTAGSPRSRRCRSNFPHSRSKARRAAGSRDSPDCGSRSWMGGRYAWRRPTSTRCESTCGTARRGSRSTGSNSRSGGWHTRRPAPVPSRCPPA